MFDLGDATVGLELLAGIVFGVGGVGFGRPVAGGCVLDLRAGGGCRVAPVYFDCGDDPGGARQRAVER